MLFSYGFDVIHMFLVCIAVQRSNNGGFADPVAYVELNGRTLMRTQDSGHYHNKLTINTIDGDVCDESEQVAETYGNVPSVVEYLQSLHSGTFVLG